MFPLPFTCQHLAYAGGAEDDHGNTAPAWADPVAVPCTWWTPTSSEPASPPTGGDRVSIDVMLVIDSGITVDHRDKFTVDNRTFTVLGLPQNYDHGPYGTAPRRQVLTLRWVG